ncbi:MAG TPA: SHOCT domain-containing protein, partial [Methylobacterium sp.]|nr:SHOCT domain-containing protein [Methylobacterium sp.]
DLAALKRVDGPPPEPVRDAAAPSSEPSEAGEPARSSGATDILATLERLAELHRKGILTEAEFTQKKADLLSRL